MEHTEELGGLALGIEFMGTLKNSLLLGTVISSERWAPGNDFLGTVVS